MPNQEWYRKLLDSIRKSHTEHATAYEKARLEFGTNRKAHQATKKELEELHKHLQEFYEKGLAPLLEGFLAGRSAAIDEVLTFLEVDIPAFRSGYSKEWYYRKMKKLALSEKQVMRLREIALARCASDEYRREDSELRRLMIKWADSRFLARVEAISAKNGSRVDGHKERLRDVILQGRKDLRDEFNSGRKQRHDS